MFTATPTTAKPPPTTFSDDEPLFLTPLLENGEIDKAKELASVQPLIGDDKSYAGFLTVNKTYGSKHFFWFFPAVKSPQTAPVVVWLQGGPGASSMSGVFYENGPYAVKDDDNNGTIFLRKYSWTEKLSVLYIDNPVGTGYSFTKQEDGYCKTEEDVSKNLYETIVQFFQLFPELSTNEFYVTGESYAGKYAPALAYAIHQANSVSKTKINLKGVAIGNGFSDPFNMLSYGDYLYKLGLIDDRERIVFNQKKDEARELIQAGKMEQALQVRLDLISGESSLFENITGFQNVFNYLYSSPHYDNDLTDQIVQRDDVRHKIHVGNLTFYNGSVCSEYLRNDIMRSVAPWIEALLDNGYKFMTYNGQLDILDAYPLTVEYLEQLDWSGAQEYKNSTRHIWKVKSNDDEVAGYVRLVRNLVEVLVRNAGHMVPVDQPRSAYDLINRFVFNKAFF